MKFPMPEEAVLYRFAEERNDLHDIAEEYLIARITTPPGVMIWGRFGDRWIPLLASSAPSRKLVGI